MTTLAPASLASRLDRLGVDVRVLAADAFPPPHRFDSCEWSARHTADVPARCIVHPADGWVVEEVCIGCLLACATWAVEQSGGRPGRVTVEVPADTWAWLAKVGRWTVEALCTDGTTYPVDEDLLLTPGTAGALAAEWTATREPLIERYQAVQVTTDVIEAWERCA